MKHARKRFNDNQFSRPTCIKWVRAKKIQENNCLLQKIFAMRKPLDLKLCYFERQIRWGKRHTNTTEHGTCKLISCAFSQQWEIKYNIRRQQHPHVFNQNLPLDSLSLSEFNYIGFAHISFKRFHFVFEIERRQHQLAIFVSSVRYFPFHRFAAQDILPA